MLINFHVYNPGRRTELVLLIIFSIGFLIIEAYEIKATGHSKKIAYVSIGLPVFTLIYSLFTLTFGHNSYINHLLPLLNFASFLRFIDDLKIFQSLRFYMKLLEKCLYELGGFFFFLILINMAFASSSLIIDRNQYRDEKID